MDAITLLTPAKINLSLGVLQRLDNGYHQVEMIMQAVGLHDTVTIEKRDKGISISCSVPYVPCDSRNIAWKAAQAFFDVCSEKGGIHIDIKKNIPVAAGLAGGSTNAAGILKGLNLLYGSPLGKEELHRLSSKLGADVAFCLDGGTQLARGIGDELTVLPDFADVNVVLVKPPFSVSTAWVYKNLNLNDLGNRPRTELLLKAVSDHDVHTVAGNMENVLESVTVRKYPEIKRIMDLLLEYGALGSRMSGSGPTVFGIFDSSDSAARAFEHFKKRYEQVFHVKTIGRGEYKA